MNKLQVAFWKGLAGITKIIGDRARKIGQYLERRSTFYDINGNYYEILANRKIGA